MKKEFEDIIKESVRSVLYEMDIVPTNKHGETNLVKKQSINAWRMIYRLMDNIKVVMDNQYKSKNGNITNKDVDGIIDYLYNSLQNVTKNTIGEK